MDRALIDRIARSVLYEGYLLYPYRKSALKNAKRWTFGTLYPDSWVKTQSGSDRSGFQAEVLFVGSGGAQVSLLARFFANEDEIEIPLETTVSEPRRQSFPNGELVFFSTALAGGAHKLTIIVRNTATLETPDLALAEERSLGSAHAVISVAEGKLVSTTDPPP